MGWCKKSHHDTDGSSREGDQNQTPGEHQLINALSTHDAAPSNHGDSYSVLNLSAVSNWFDAICFIYPRPVAVYFRRMTFPPT